MCLEYLIIYLFPFHLFSTFVSVAIPCNRYVPFILFPYTINVFFFLLTLCVGKVKAISKLFINFYSKISLKHENFAKDKFLSCCGRMNRKKHTSKRNRRKV